MGGNIVLKLAGEWGTAAPPQFRAVVAVCPAIDLSTSSDALHQRANYLYEKYFLWALRRRMLQKARLFPGQFDVSRLRGIRSLREFDDKITAFYCGFTGVDDVFSGERNFLDAYSARPEPSHLAEALGERFEIMATNIKKWSVGSPAQAALDALTHLMDGAAFGIGAVASIRVHLPTRSARTVDNAPMPDVNVQHLMALLLTDRALTFNSVHDHARMHDPAVLAVRRLIELVPSLELAEAQPPRQAIVEISLQSGRSLTHRTRAVRGTADNPMTRAEVEMKALDLMRGPLGAERARDLVEACRRIEYSPDISEFARYWVPPSGTVD